MDEILPYLIASLVLMALLQLGGPRLRAPVPVLLALAGTLVGFLPNVVRVELDPDLVLVLFLPPLLHAGAFDTSWIDFRRWLRPIFMLAVGLVAVTTLCVGLVAHRFLPGLPLSVCFLLGAIVSPTDTVAVQAVLERLRVPRRVTAILGGESLVNDATGLVGVQLALAVAMSEAFTATGIALRFAWVAGLGIAIGAATGWAFAVANRRVRDVTALWVLSLLAPYLAFALARASGASGVLAVVVAGFVVAWRVHDLHSEARVQLYTTWSLFVYLLDGACFLFIGFETPHLLRELHSGGDGGSVLLAGACVSVAVILTRITWCFASGYASLKLFPMLRAREGGYYDPRHLTLISWCGLRGVVSLAAALAVPRLLPDGSPFPGRAEVQACTLLVILATLIGQGVLLTPLIRMLGIRRDESSGEEERAAREALLESGIARLDAFCSERTCPLSVHHWRTAMADELTSLRDADLEQRRHASARLAVSQEVRGAVAKAQEAALLVLRDRGAINDKTYVTLQLELDRNYLSGAMPGRG